MCRRTCDSTNQISVLVGLEEYLFLVHKDIICAKSRFFAAAYSERWIEGKERKFRLPDVDASVFQSYLAWVYCKQLDVTYFDSNFIDEDIPDRARTVAMYFELYLLGDSLDDIRLRNKVLQTLVLDTESLPRPETVRQVWKNTLESSLVRRMMVDRVTIRVRRTYLLENPAKYLQGFVQQVAAALLQEVPKMDQEVFMKLPPYLELVEPVD